MAKRGREPGVKLTRVVGEFDKNYRLAVDSHGFIIQERSEKDTEDGEKEEIWTSKYWYSKLKDCVHGYAKHLARRKSSKKFKDLVEAINSWEQTVEKAAARLEETIQSPFDEKGENEKTE